MCFRRARILVKSGRGSSEGGFFRKSATSSKSIMASILEETRMIARTIGGD